MVDFDRNSGHNTTMKASLIRPIIFSLLGAGLIWLPVVNDLASGTSIADPLFRFGSSVLATLGVWGLVWLNWGLRRRAARKNSQQ